MQVLSSRKSRLSGDTLEAALRDAGYDGPQICWGYSGVSTITSGMLNLPGAVALATNKRLALIAMTRAGVPTLLIDPRGITEWPVVARPDHHHAGRFLRICEDYSQLCHHMRPRLGRGRKAQCTHVQRYLGSAREFRVHVVNGLSIKISEKIGESGNHSTGAVFTSRIEDGHRVTMRGIAKDAVAALGLDFGAVDLMYRDGQFYVLEVNTAPCLTDPNSDTLARYVRAFCQDGPDA